MHMTGNICELKPHTWCPRTDILHLSALSLIWLVSTSLLAYNLNVTTTTSIQPPFMERYSEFWCFVPTTNDESYKFNCLTAEVSVAAHFWTELTLSKLSAFCSIRRGHDSYRNWGSRANDADTVKFTIPLSESIHQWQITQGHCNV